MMLRLSTEQGARDATDCSKERPVNSRRRSLLSSFTFLSFLADWSVHYPVTLTPSPPVGRVDRTSGVRPGSAAVGNEMTRQTLTTVCSPIVVARKFVRARASVMLKYCLSNL